MVMGTPTSLDAIRKAQRADGPAGILAIGTANPANHVIQAEYPDYYFRITNSEHMTDLKEKFKRMCDKSTIRKRHMHLTEEFLKENPDMCAYMAPSLDARQDIVVVEVPKLGKEAAVKAIKEWGQPKSKITHVVFCTTSGVDMPGADYQLTKLLGLRPSVKRLMMYQQGCFAGGTVLRLAKDLAENNRGARVLVVCSEITAVTFRGPSDTHLDSLVGQALFSDGAAALIVGWEAVWPRLLARGWHSEQPKDRSYITSKDNIVFIVPGVKRFSRGELVKGDHYFDSVSDILTKVASEPELLEVETGGGGEIVNESVNSSDQSDEELPPSDSQRHRYLKSPSSSRGNLQMRFTVVDTSLASGGKLCDLRNLKVSETKTGLGDKDSSSLSSQNVEMPSLDAPMRFVIVDTSLDHRKKWSGLRRWKRLPSDGRNKDDSSVKEEEESLERVKDPSKRLIKKHRAEDTNHHSVKSAPSLKRRRLSACVKREKSLSKEDPESDSLSLCAVQHKNSTVEEMSEDKERYENVDYMKLKSDQSEKTGTGPSSAVVETQEMSETKPNGLCSVSGEDNDCSPEEVRTSHELISSEHHSNGLCSASGSDKGRVSIDTEQEQEVELHQKATIDHPVNTQELGSSEQQEANTDAPRRHSTRKRPLTTRALEALESCLLTTEIMETTVKPRKRERSSRKKHSAKVSNRAQLLPDNGITDKEQRGGEDGSKATASNNPLDQIEDTKPSFIVNGAATESSKPPLDRRHDSKPALTEHPKLPPIILKLSLKRSRASET